jgi:hypothetical protein
VATASPKLPDDVAPVLEAQLTPERPGVVVSDEPRVIEQPAAAPEPVEVEHAAAVPDYRPQDGPHEFKKRVPAPSTLRHRAAGSAPRSLIPLSGDRR